MFTHSTGTNQQNMRMKFAWKSCVLRCQVSSQNVSNISSVNSRKRWVSPVKVTGLHRSPMDLDNSSGMTSWTRTVCPRTWIWSGFRNRSVAW